MSSEIAGPPTDPDVAPSRARVMWAIAFVALTLAAIAAAIWWLPSAFADPSGGCGGG